LVQDAVGVVIRIGATVLVVPTVEIFGAIGTTVDVIRDRILVGVADDTAVILLGL
jgi:hypothetical protein